MIGHSAAVQRQNDGILEMTTSPKVLIEKNGPVTTVVINRPEARNAVDNETADALADAFRAFEADSSAHAAVLTGAGGAFCAGADLKAVASGERQIRYRQDEDGPMGPSRLALSKPVIAAIAGHAVAGGLELALWCDLRVMEEDAVLGVFCRRFGMPLIDGGTVRLPRLIGTSRALDLILTGRPVGAAEALEFGLANRIVANGAARAAAESLAADIAAFPQLCLRKDRESVYRQADMPFDDAMRVEFREGLAVVEREGRAGAARFVGGKGRHGQFED